MMSEQRKILLVEDHKGVRGMLTEVLDSKGWRVLSAADAPQALEIAKETKDLAALLTDMNLGEAKGEYVAQEVLQYNPGIHVVYMSLATREELGGRLSPDARFWCKQSMDLEELEALLR
jgi:CheY-like chemotaxis protein